MRDVTLRCGNNVVIVGDGAPLIERLAYPPMKLLRGDGSLTMLGETDWASLHAFADDLKRLCIAAEEAQEPSR